MYVYIMGYVMFIYTIYICIYMHMHARRNRGGVWGAIAPPPNILPTKKIKSLKIVIYK